MTSTARHAAVATRAAQPKSAQRLVGDGAPNPIRNPASDVAPDSASDVSRNGARNPAPGTSAFWWVRAILSSLLLILAIAALLAGVVVPRIADATAYTILTGSMQPTLPPGDLVVMQKINADEIAVGDVVTYQLESGVQAVVTHRVVAIAQNTLGERTFTTQGDANNVADEAPVRAVQIRGALWYQVPYLGYVNTVFTGAQRGITIILVIGALLVYAALMFLQASRDRRRLLATATAGLVALPLAVVLAVAVSFPGAGPDAAAAMTSAVTTASATAPAAVAPAATTAAAVTPAVTTASATAPAAGAPAAVAPAAGAPAAVAPAAVAPAATTAAALTSAMTTAPATASATAPATTPVAPAAISASAPSDRGTPTPLPLLSLDGTTWSTSVESPLLHDGDVLVPGSATSVRIWVQNPTPDAAQLTFNILATPGFPLWQALLVTAEVSGVPATLTSGDSTAQVWLKVPALEAATKLPVDVTFQLNPASGNETQNAVVPVAFRVALTQNLPGGPGGTPTPLPTPSPSANTTQSTSTNALPNALGATGDASTLILLKTSGALVLCGLLLVFFRMIRRSKDDAR